MMTTKWIARLAPSVLFLSCLLYDSSYGLQPLSSSSTRRVSKKALPEQELVNRRKSPALWRDDLQQSPSSLVPTTTTTTTTTNRRLLQRPPQVMAPAGGWPQLKAAVANGADAVYLGLSQYSARARAANFDPVTELPEAVKYCHSHGVHVYVALNTLVFDDELEAVSELLQLIDKAHVDAVIVQDLGVAQLAQQVAPNLILHASTQQTVTSAEGVLFAAQQSHATRVVLGRELSVTEIQQIAMAAPDIEIEAFVHGALCVSYSGQCFSSESWGGRSANRGQCAQACRLPYGLIVDGTLRDLQDMPYLLSPQDLCGLEQVPALIQAGVGCLKIEGRLKDEAYVAATTRAYRNAVDEAWAELTRHDDMTTPSSTGNNERSSLLAQPEQVTRQELAQLFSRGQDEHNDGLTPGFFEGTQHQLVVRGRSPRHRGVHVGRVQEGSSFKNGLIIQADSSSDSLKLGDGLVVDRGLAQEEELGGPVFDLDSTSIPGSVIVRFGREVERKWKKADDSARKGMGTRRPLAPVGAHVWKTSDATVEKKMRRLSESAPPRMLVRVSVQGDIGQPLTVTISSRDDVTVIGVSDHVLEPAETSGLDLSKVKKAVGTLGNTRWAIDGDIDITGLSEAAWCPVSWIKEARRRAVEELNAKYDMDSQEDDQHALVMGAATRMLQEVAATSNSEKPDASTPRESPTSTRLSVLARNLDQVDAVCRMAERGDAIDEIIVDFLEVDGMRDAVTRIRQAGLLAIVASPRILKPGESGIWRTLLRLEPDGILVRSTGFLYRMTQLGGAGAKVNVGGSDTEEEWVGIPKLYGDFSLNVANALTAMELLDSGLERVTASYDLNANAITSLARMLGTARAQRLEVVVHAKLPIFHTEHCVFARFLSNGNSYLDCGHVCTRHNVHLRDTQTGADNLVLADMGCRNTVFAAQAQSGIHSLGQWADTGVGHVRIELVDEGPNDAEMIVSGYLGVLAGSLKPSRVWESLQQVQDSNGRTAGVSHGSFRNMAERPAGAL